jgi:hypothetical protein
MFRCFRNSRVSQEQVSPPQLAKKVHFVQITARFFSLLRERKLSVIHMCYANLRRWRGQFQIHEHFFKLYESEAFLCDLSS